MFCPAFTRLINLSNEKGVSSLFAKSSEVHGKSPRWSGWYVRILLDGSTLSIPGRAHSWLEGGKILAAAFEGAAP